MLSVYQSDIIVYGGDLRSYLLAELADLLDVEPEPQPGVCTAEIPFWGELIG